MGATRGLAPPVTCCSATSHASRNSRKDSPAKKANMARPSGSSALETCAIFPGTSLTLCRSSKLITALKDAGARCRLSETDASCAITSPNFPVSCITCLKNSARGAITRARSKCRLINISRSSISSATRASSNPNASPLACDCRSI